MEIYTFDPVGDQVSELLVTGDSAPGERTGAAWVLYEGGACCGYPCPGGGLAADDLVNCCDCVDCPDACFGRRELDQTCADPLSADFIVTGISADGTVLFESYVIRTCPGPVSDCSDWSPTFLSNGFFTYDGVEATTVFLCGPDGCEPGSIFYDHDGDTNRGIPRMSPQGWSIFSAVTAESCGDDKYRTLYSTSATMPSCRITRVGDPAPGGGTFTVPYSSLDSTFFGFARHPAVEDAAAFFGSVDSASQKYRLVYWRRTDSPAMTYIAQTGDPAPVGAEDVTFFFTFESECDVGELGVKGPDVVFTAPNLGPLDDPYENGMFTWDYQEGVVQHLFDDEQNHASLGGRLRSPDNPIIETKKVFFGATLHEAGPSGDSYEGVFEWGSDEIPRAIVLTGDALPPPQCFSEIVFPNEFDVNDNGVIAMVAEILPPVGDSLSAILLLTPAESCGNPGACCYDDGGVETCEVMTQSCCDDLLGIYAGDGTTCDPAGACCYDDGEVYTCREFALSCCTVLDGVYAGDDTNCEPSGACCYDADEDTHIDTCEVMPQSCCEALGGVYGGDDSTCEPSGACCYDADEDGYIDTCEVIAQSCCDALAGVYGGDGSTCEPSGACCYNDGGAGVCEVMAESCCDALSGLYGGDDTECGQAGACCYDAGDDAFIDHCDELPESCCNAYTTSVFHGVDTACGPNSTCCYDRTGDGIGESCISIPPLCCGDLDGFVSDPGTTCFARACCYNDYQDCSLLSEPCCDERSGVFLPFTLECAAAQACCLPNGECSMLNHECCTETGGTPRGEGSACTSPAVCCLSGCRCEELDPVCCELREGESDPLEPDCDTDGDGIDDACEPCIPAVSEWGLLVMTLLVAAAGAVVIRRRRLIPA